MKATFRTLALATTAAVTLMAASVAPAAAGSSERAFIKGVAAAVIVHEVVRHSRAQGARRAAPNYTTYATVPSTRYYAPQQTQVVRYAPQPTRSSPYRDPAVYASALAYGFDDLRHEDRRDVQRQLRALGYYSGGIDGIWGPQTNRAVRAYARDAGALTTIANADDAYRLYTTLLY